MRKRIKLIALWTTLAAVTVLGGTLGAMNIRFHPTPKLAPHGKPDNLTQAQQQDLDDLAVLMQVDRSFDAAARAAFATELEKLRSLAGRMSAPQFSMAARRLVALSGNGHTRLSGVTAGRVPLRLAWFANELYVVRTHGAANPLLGARVISLDGRTPEQAFAETQPFVSGTPEHARIEGLAILEAPSMLQVIWPDSDGVHLLVRAQLPSAAIVDVSVSAAAAVALPRWQDVQVTVLAPVSSADAGWQSVIAGAPQVPLALREPDRAVYRADLPNGGQYLRLNAIVDDGHGTLRQQLADAIDAAPAAGWRYLVVDLRFNSGGDYTKTLGFTRRLSRALRLDGPLWLLTSNATFSAAIVTLARAKFFTGERAHIVGERIGDNGRFFSESGKPLRAPKRRSHHLLRHRYARLGKRLYRLVAVLLAERVFWRESRIAKSRGRNILAP